MMNGTAGPGDGSGWYSRGTVLGSSREKNNRGDQESLFSLQHSTASSRGLGACSQRPPCSTAAVLPPASRRRQMEKEEMHGHCDGHTGHLGEEGGHCGAQLWAQLTPIPWSCLTFSPKQGSGGEVSVILGLSSLGSAPHQEGSWARQVTGRRPQTASHPFLAPELTNHLLVAHLVGLHPLTGHEEALSRGQRKNKIHVDCGPLRSGNPVQAEDLAKEDSPVSLAPFQPGLAGVGVLRAARGSAHPKGSPRPEHFRAGCGV